MIHHVKRVRKTSGDLDDNKQALVTTTDTIFKEGNTDMVDKEGKSKKICGGIHHSLYFRRKKLTQSTEQRNHKHPIKQ